MVLVDTSSWTQSLRRAGDSAVRERVRKLIVSGDAAWCDMVRVELWNGAAGEQEKKRLREFDAELPRLPIDDEVWELACAIGRLARENSITVPNADLVIFACAHHHKAPMDHCDRHFDALDAMMKRTGGK